MGNVTLHKLAASLFAYPAAHQTMFKSPFALALFIVGLYLFLNIMASDEQKKENQETLIDMGGKKVPISKISKPHNVVVGGANKPVPNLENFPSLEPWAQAQEQKDSTKEDKIEKDA